MFQAIGRRGAESARRYFHASRRAANGGTPGTTPGASIPPGSLLRPPPVHRMLDAAPAHAYRPAGSRIFVRKNPAHVPAVQRWSALWPHDEVTLAILGVQARDAESIAASSFTQWADSALALPGAPTTVDHARFTDRAGMLNHVVTAYFLRPGSYAEWATQPGVGSWWSAAERTSDTVGVYREIIRVPTSRIETIYWPDYPGGAMKDESVEIYPTPYCGYYGAMRDRLAAAADDELAAVTDGAWTRRAGLGARWRVAVPANVAIIRSSHTWSAMDAGQLADYGAKLAPPLDRGMAYLATRPAGCLDLRNHVSATPQGADVPEMHATGVFTDLSAMEGWAGRHETHAAIFRAAIARYRHYGGANQLRTWHEVYVLAGGDVFEYANCHPETGLLGYFVGERVG